MTPAEPAPQRDTRPPSEASSGDEGDAIFTTRHAPARHLPGKGAPAAAPENDASNAAWSLLGGSRAESVRTVGWCNLTSLRSLREGVFATVYEGTLEGQQVALKTLKPSTCDDEKAVLGLKRETMLMALMRHQNVLSMVALGDESGKPFLVLPRLESVLADELPSDPSSMAFWVRRRQVKAWPLSRAIRHGIDLSRALEYCHDHAFAGFRVLHRDVTPKNVGFLNGRLVLFDFGLASLWAVDAQQAPDEAHDLAYLHGSVRYTSPEVANSEPYCHKTDVFSFATVLWEMAAHRRPFSMFLDDQLPAVLAKSVTPPMPKGWPDGLQELLRECWSRDQDKRPEFRELVTRLEALSVVATLGSIKENRVCP